MSAKNSAKNIEDLYSLSPMQQGMLFHSLYAPESGVYVEQVSADLQGELNIPAFEQAWQQVVDRHPILRTAFVWEKVEKPLQVVGRQVHLPLIVHDWQNLTIADQQTKLEALRQAEQIQGFELSKAPLIRLILIQLAAQQYHFLWSHHHLLLDGWSTSLILQEVFAFYEAACQNQSLRLPKPRPYRDYIGWLQQQSLPQAEAFWRQTLKGFTAPTPFSVDIDRSLSSSQTNSEKHHVSLSQETTAALQSLARQHQLTLNTVVQGAWALLLSRYSGESDVVFGTTVSGRPTTLAGAEEMVGLFINTLPVRVQVESERSLLSWLQRFQSQQAEARQYEYTPLVQIQQWSEIPANTPLFESIVVFENYPIDPNIEQGNNNLAIRRVQVSEQTNYPLTVIVRPDAELEITFLYDRARFDADTIARMLRHLQTLLKGMVADPDRCLWELPLLTPAEQHQLLVEWNDTDVAYSQDSCLHHSFELQVERTPDSVAVIYEDQKLTYRELNERANQLAHYLQSLGVTPDVLVGICVERSIEMVVGLLAILKAGGAYLPLDPSYPPDRLAFMLEDAQVPVLLTMARQQNKLLAQGAKVVYLDRDADLISQQPLDNLVSEVTANHLAYVIYTSGSTGKPKGVLINHANVVRLFAATQSWYHFNEQDVWTLFHSYAFDFSVWELWGALLHGGRLVVVPYWSSRSPEAFHNLLCKEQVTVLNQTPSAFRQLIQVEESLNTTSSLNLRLVIFGGEALSFQSLQPWFERHGDRSPQLVNMYGITETTVHVTYHPLTLAALNETRSVIGKPIPDLQVYILDQHQQPVPIGVPGEMYVGGAGVARGYLNRPELTVERFISNPFSNHSNARLYKSGDLARYLPNGEIEYLGRIDHQVKIRGFRIELGEIGALLCQHSQVHQAVVIDREDTPGDKRLVAYIVPCSSLDIKHSQLNDLRHFLHTQLPDYMVPSAFVLLEALPLTVNGKLDRRALPAPDSSLLESNDRPTAPRTPIEEIVSGIWAKVLGLRQVGIDDNFFELGGHSLLATQVISQIRSIFQIELPLRGLFEAPTLAAFAKEIELALGTEHQLQIPPIDRVSRLDTLPLSFAQQRLWFLHQLDPDDTSYSMPAAVRLQGQLNVTALEQSLNAIVQRHEILRTQFVTIAGQPTQMILPTVTLPLVQVDLQYLSSSEQDAEVQKLALQETQLSFDLSQAPLLRSTLLQLAENNFVLLLTMHHIVSDGWSIGVFIEEIVQLYAAFAQGQSSPLSELPIQYGDFAVWQRQWLQGEVLETQLAYWKQQLAGDLPVLELPSDRPRPAVQSFRGATRSFQLPPDLSTTLKTFSQQQGATLFMTLLTAFKTLLYRYTRQEDILVGSPIANRNRAELEGLIGCFVNTLVLRTDLSGNPSFQTVLKRVREVALAAYAHQDVPFEKLVEALQPDRDLSHNPLFQVMFVLQNAPMPTLELPELTLNALEIDSETATFDLTLTLVETPTGLSGTCEYNTDLFEPETIAHMLGHFQTLLQGIIANPKQQISELPLLTEAEQQRLVEWGNRNKSLVTQNDNLCIHQLFEAQVERTPDAIALVHKNRHLTYAELNNRANHVAQELRSFGVQPETLVGICTDRSPEMIIGILGILKAGGAYVPLDPTYPRDRLAFMLSDTQVSILLTQTHLLNTLPEHTANVLCLDTIHFPTSPSLHLPISATPSNLAYVIYTSGSTGKPKGVLVEHRAICSRLLWGQTIYRLSESDRVLQKASFCFDVSIGEIFGALISGAQLVLASADIVQDSAALIQFIAEHQITVIDFVPSLLQVFLEEDGLETACRSLRYITCGGEALSAQLQARCFAHLPDVELHNLYGPTEAAIDATWEVCQPEATQSVSIGRPIANTQIYLLDRNLQPVPIGVPGEIYIGGIGLARGYLNQPDLTAEKFVPNPFRGNGAWEIESTRLYRTGDLARWRSDGRIEFLGRIDDQVKIRGFRVELGEIEAALEQHPAIQQAIAMVREDMPNRKQLVAYIVPTIPDLLLPSLRQFLKTRLPDYMLPSAFVQLETVPLTANGKIDRRKLPAPDRSHLAAKAPLVAASRPVEQQLIDVWQQVLGVEPIGIHDNFFELGGDSILSIQVVARANQEGLRITAKQLFQYQTIAELAAVVDTAEVLQAEQGAVSGELSLTPIQHWFFEQALPNPNHYNQATLLEVPANLDATQIEQVVRQLIIHHDALRLRFEFTESGIRQVNALPEDVLPEDRVQLIEIDLSDVPEPEQANAIAQQADELQASLCLATGALVRVALFRLGADKPGRLLIIIHHLAIDGVSWRILLDDFQTIYAQLQQQQPIQLPAKTTSFKHWAQRLTEYGQSTALQQELNYWLTVSQQSASPLPVDTDGMNTTASVNTLTVTLTASETQALLQEVPTVYRTQINDVLLTALAQTFAQWTGSPLQVDLEGHGREQLFPDVDLSRTVGWFTSSFPVYLDVSNADDIGDALRTVKEQLRHIPNQGIGYGILRYLSRSDIAVKLRDLPQAEVSFNYLGQFDTTLDSATTFKLAEESTGAVHDPEGIRPYLLEIDGFIAANQLHLEWSYSSAIHHHKTIAHLAQGFVEALRSIIAHCRSSDAGGYTPSDFQAAKISQKDFNKLLAKLSQTGRHSS